MVNEQVNSNPLKQANISLILDSYEDIFSSFDPRSYPERALSDDFLIECRKAARDKAENYMELLLSVPSSKRVTADELKIKKRLKAHFQKHFLEKEKEIMKIRKSGAIWVCIGIIINIIVVYGLINFSNIVIHSILSILEIPSWFLIWEGLGKIFMESKKMQAEHLFYKKMANCQVTFRSY